MCQINFNINASDSDGTVVSGEGRYKLTSSSTWTTFNISSITNAQTPDITVEGDYDLEVRVQDNDGAYSAWTTGPNFKIGNCSPNVGPIANAGTDQAIQLPTNTVTLNGSGSSDPDGTIVSFAWTVTGGTLNNSSISNPTWSLPNTAGSYTATLTVTDNDNASASDSMVTTIQSAQVFLNTQQSQAFTKNDCPSGSTGSTVTYVVAAGTYSSTIDQATANNLAINDVNANGQAYANTQGTCTNVAPTVTGITYGSGNCCEPTTQSGSAYVSSPVVGSGLCNKTVQFTITGAPNEVVNYNLTFSPVAGRNQSNVVITLNSSGEGSVNTNIGAGASAQTNGSDSVTLDVLNTSSSFDSATASMSFTNCAV